MMKKEYEERITTKTENILISKRMYCDKCGKEINGDYFMVTTGHYDWENDSGDSIEFSDYCSVKCLNSAMNEYFTNGDGKHRKTAYFDIEKEYFVSKGKKKDER